jgi:5-formyltetrahydrofolate cyclo-ligase
MPLPIQKSVAKTASLPIHKSAANYAATESEIDNQLCRYQIRNRQPKTMALPIQKSAAKLQRCRFKNWQPETVSLPIQKSAAMVESFRFTSLFFFPGVYNYNGNNNFPS